MFPEGWVPCSLCTPVSAQGSSSGPWNFPWVEPGLPAPETLSEAKEASPKSHPLRPQPTTPFLSLRRMPHAPVAQGPQGGRRASHLETSYGSAPALHSLAPSEPRSPVPIPAVATISCFQKTMGQGRPLFRSSWGLRTYLPWSACRVETLLHRDPPRPSQVSLSVSGSSLGRGEWTKDALFRPQTHAQRRQVRMRKKTTPRPGQGDL